MEKPRIVYMIEGNGRYSSLRGIWDDIEELANWVSAQGRATRLYGNVYQTGLDMYMAENTVSSIEIGVEYNKKRLEWSHFFPTE